MSKNEYKKMTQEQLMRYYNCYKEKVIEILETPSIVMLAVDYIKEMKLINEVIKEKKADGIEKEKMED